MAMQAQEQPGIHASISLHMGEAPVTSTHMLHTLHISTDLLPCLVYLSTYLPTTQVTRRDMPMHVQSQLQAVAKPAQRVLRHTLPATNMRKTVSRATRPELRDWLVGHMALCHDVMTYLPPTACQSHAHKHGGHATENTHRIKRRGGR